jgi:type VI secretion system secreted protein Hcp
MPIYMQYGGIKGESVPGLPGPGWIEINSFQWGVGRGISSPTGGSADRESSAPSVSEIVVTKDTDASSPNLFQHCLGGTRLGISIVFTSATKPGGPRHKLDLRDALIADIHPCAMRSGRGEKLTFTFSEHHFNGVPNGPIPHAFASGPGDETPM